MFKDQYYGNLGLRHENVGYFQGADILFFEGLATQLASTIHRLETVQARQEFEQRALAAEAMSTIGQIAFELTHHWDNHLGLVRSYVNDIRSKLERLDVTDMSVSGKLDNIVRAVHTVLDLSEGLKLELLKSGQARASEPVVIHPKVLLEEALDLPSLPRTIQISLEIEQDVTYVRVMHSLATDILHNLVTNAIQAMPEGGNITLRARNSGRSVALEVSDTGPGIPEENFSKIFDLFYSTKGSTGFGLWSARRNALSNHGNLTVNSVVGEGTTFTLLLPKVGGEIL
jgi:signal transduction histidine kinase